MNALMDPVTPNLLATLALLTWPLVCALVFFSVSRRRAVILLLIGGFLFLPSTGLRTVAPVPLLNNRLETISAFVFLLSLIFDRRPWQRLRFHWADLPIFVFCLAPMLSSLSNGLGLYDALQAGLVRTLAWGGPYALGRAYFGNLAGARDLAIAFVTGGLIYLPLCLYEVRLSPQLHRMLYGWAQHNFGMTVRMNGYRPMVFLEMGLMLGLWMGVTALTACWLWWSGAIKAIWKVPIRWAAVALVATEILCKSTGAIALTVAGIALYPACRWLRASSLLVVLLALTPAAYCALRTNGWSAQSLVETSSELVDASRAQSLDFRLENENLLVEKALQRPLLGWAGWGRSRVYDAEGRDISVTDGLWVIELGQDGLLGLIALLATLALPSLLLLALASPRRWFLPALAPAAALALALSVYAIDCLFNAMINPLYALAAGGLTGCYVTLRRTVVARVRPQVRSFATALPGR